MIKTNIFSKIDNVYTQFVEAIVGDIPIDDEEFRVQQEEKAKANNKHKVAKIKKETVADVGLTETLLTLGTPETDDILYEKLVKKERREAKKIKTLKKLAKLEKKTEKALKKQAKKLNKELDKKKKKSS